MQDVKTCCAPFRLSTLLHTGAHVFRGCWKSSDACAMAQLQDRLDIHPADAGGAGDCMYLSVANILVGHECMQGVDMEAAPGYLRGVVASRLMESERARAMVRSVAVLGAEVFADPCEVKDTWMGLEELWGVMDAAISEDELDDVLSIIAVAVANTEAPVLWGSQLELMVLNEWLADEPRERVFLTVATPEKTLQNVGKELISNCDACSSIGVLFKNDAHFRYGQVRGQTLFDVSIFTDHVSGGGKDITNAPAAIMMIITALVVCLLPR